MPVQSPERPSGFRWIVFTLACGTSWLLYFHRYVFGLIKPTLADEWGLRKDQMGLLDGAFSTFYTGMQFPIGVLADVVGVRIVLTLLGIVGSIGLALHAWAPSPQELAFARGLLGAGQSAVFACLSRVTRNWFPFSQRTTIQGWVGVFFGRIGGVSCNLIVGGLLLGYFKLPWRIVVYSMAGLGIAQAIAFFWLFRNSPKEHPAVNEEEVELIGNSDADSAATAGRLTVFQMLKQLKFRRLFNLVVVNIQTILSTLADNIFSAWIPLFLADVHHLDFKKMGVYSALPLLGGAIGGATGGWLNDLAIRRLGSRRWARSLVGFAGKGIAAVLLMMALYWYADPYKFCIMLFFVKFFSDWSLTTTWGVVTDIGGKASASVFAYNNSVAGVGSIIAPIMFGFVAEYHGWVPVFEIAALTYLGCALSWLLINCTLSVISEESAKLDS